MGGVISSLLPRVEPFKGGYRRPPKPPKPPAAPPSNSENTYARGQMYSGAPILNGPIVCPAGLVRALPADYVVKLYWGCGANCPDHNKYHGALENGTQQNYGITDDGCGCACITVEESNRRKAAERERQRLAAEAAERERQRLAAIAAARERVRAKAAAKAAYDTAVTAATNAFSAYTAQQSQYDAAINTAIPLKTAYDNIQGVATNAKAKKAAYDSAVEQKNTASTLLTTSTTAFSSAKAKVKTAWETAETAASTALTAYRKQETEYGAAINTALSLKTAYENAQMAMTNARAKKAVYDDAVLQKTGASALLTAASNELNRVNAKVKGSIDNQYAEQAQFIKNAVVFPNATFGLDNKYNTMSIDWTAYTSAKEELAAALETNKITDSTAATDRLVETYNKFVASKDIYSSSIIPVLKSSTADSDYIRNNEINATTYEGVYGLRNKEYRPMVDAWAKVVQSINASDIFGILANYSIYLVAKTKYASALLVAQNKQAEAEFQTKLAAGRTAATQWAQSGAGGCRNIQTKATLDPDMLDQNMTCSDTEYISGYSNVSGFYAAPADPVSKKNIAQYLAVKYSCCAVPSGAKGSRGKKGLPGLEGVPGVTGPTGADGIFGSVGMKGERGDMGEEGGKGPRGDTGDEGISGEPGQPGVAGRSMKVPLIKQRPGPIGQPGIMGPMGIQGPKGKDGIILPAPKQPPSELDRTISLFDIQEKINKYMRG